jgi:hypothetical protein
MRQLWSFQLWRQLYIYNQDFKPWLGFPLTKKTTEITLNPELRFGVPFTQCPSLLIITEPKPRSKNFLNLCQNLVRHDCSRRFNSIHLRNSSEYMPQWYFSRNKKNYLIFIIQGGHKNYITIKLSLPSLSLWLTQPSTFPQYGPGPVIALIWQQHWRRPASFSHIHAVFPPWGPVPHDA